MAEDIRLRIGVEVATLNLNNTPAKISKVIERYMRRMGIPITGVAQTDMLAFLTHWVDETKRVSKEAQVAELTAQNLESISQTIENDNAL